jgi:dimeric dUTPase (all-alpha-NTP-PPase superfamily)
MDLSKLFPMQAELDAHIVKEKGLEGQDLLKKKTVALICELYECVNELQVFKFWKANPKPRTEIINICTTCDGTGDENYVNYLDNLECGRTHDFIKCEDCDGKGELGTRSPMLEEFADTIHFALSIANDLGYTEHKYEDPGTMDLNDLTLGITNTATMIPYMHEKSRKLQIKSLLNKTIKLGYQLGFTEKDVISAYKDKHEVNYARQQNGY